MVQSEIIAGQPARANDPGSRSKVAVVTDHAFATLALERAVAEQYGAQFVEHQCASEEDTLAAVTGATAVLVNLAPMTRRVLATLAPGASVIRYGVGYDNVDTEAARELGIAVANTADYGTSTVADHSAALLLSVLRRLPQFNNSVRDEGWASPLRFGPIASFADVTVGLIGTGRIGLALADRLRPFGFTVIAHDPYIDPAIATDHGVILVEREELFSRVDALSLHLPLTADTHHLVDATVLASMRAGSVLVNTSRGGLVDADALADALDRGHLAAAALDVFENEPLPGEARLRHYDQVILTPHVAFYSTASMENLQRLASEELGRALSGIPLIGRVA